MSVRLDVDTELKRSDPMKKEYTTIAISRELHAKLCQLGRKGETFEDILKRIMKKAGIKDKG